MGQKKAAQWHHRVLDDEASQNSRGQSEDAFKIGEGQGKSHAQHDHAKPQRNQISFEPDDQRGMVQSKASAKEKPQRKKSDKQTIRIRLRKAPPAPADIASRTEPPGKEQPLPARPLAAANNPPHYRSYENPDA